MFKVDPHTLDARLYFFRERLEQLLSQCYFKYRKELRKHSYENRTEILPRCEASSSEESGIFIVRVVDVKQAYTEADSDEVSIVTITVQNSTSAISRNFLLGLFVYMGKTNIDNIVNLEYYTGNIRHNKVEKFWYDGDVKWILIGVGCKHCYYIFKENFSRFRLRFQQ